MMITAKQFTWLMTAATMAPLLSAIPPEPPAGLGTPTITLATSPQATHRSEDLTPSSQLTRTEALAVASLFARVNGKDIVISAVAPTGSMRPYFDENAFLLLEVVPFDDLKLGDVVTFYHPKLRVEVVHRLLEKRGAAFWSKGDHNRSMDDVYVTAENFHRRLVGVIYFQPDPAPHPPAVSTAVAISNSTGPSRPRS